MITYVKTNLNDKVSCLLSLGNRTSLELPLVKFERLCSSSLSVSLIQVHACHNFTTIADTTTKPGPKATCISIAASQGERSGSKTEREIIKQALKKASFGLPEQPTTPIPTPFQSTSVCSEVNICKKSFQECRFMHTRTFVNNGSKYVYLRQQNCTREVVHPNRCSC